MNCAISFGKELTFHEAEEECPICLEDLPAVELPNCTHRLCVTCFRRIQWQESEGDSEEAEDESDRPYDKNLAMCPLCRKP
jgi:hypothetical protein